MTSLLRRSLPISLALTLLIAASPARAQDPAAGSVPLDAPTAPVQIDGQTLFRVRGVSAYPAEKRAALVADRVEAAAADPKFDPASLEVRETDLGSLIVGGDHQLLTLIDADARLEGVKRSELALVYLPIIRSAVADYRAARNERRLATGAGRAAILTLVLVLALWLIRFVVRRLDAFVARRYQRRLEGFKVGSLELVRAERVRGAVRAVLRTLRAALLLVLLYVYLQRVLGLFPWTRVVSNQLADWVVAPLLTLGAAFVANVPNLLFLFVLAVVVRYALKLLRVVFDGIARGTVSFEGFDPEWAAPTYKIVRTLVVAFAVVVAYPYIPGSESGAFKGVSLFLGVVFSLGSTSIIANTIAGYTMIYRRAFRVGDRVKIGEVVGDITDVRLQVTHLRTAKNEEVVVPNSVILNSEVTNYSTLAKTKGLVLHTTVGIGYETPWRQVEEMLKMAAARTPGLLEDPAPFVHQRGLGDFCVTYELNAYCRDPQAMWLLYSDLHRSIQDVFNEYGVQIMTPAYEADTPEPKVVPKEQWYAAPAKPPVGPGPEAGPKGR